MHIDRRRARWIGELVWIAWLPVAACATDRDMPEPPARSLSQQHDAGADVAAAPEFADVYALFTKRCGGGNSGCHITGMSAGLLMPDAAAAYDHLVGTASAKCAGEMRVVTGDADASVLMQALEGSASCVKPMPLGRDPLSAGEIAMVRAWINDGAAD